jgi:hypothetical protein
MPPKTETVEISISTLRGPAPPNPESRISSKLERSTRNFVD